jgi:GalNAc-alpha-(1->4)-GalNAc-alpha-(1->3)-diNAcBac-PP-undecaprenol alpha-1,4-N-acetyl-D-galactosaminyltransferase
MSKGNITLIFNHFEFGREHLGKDVFLIPHHLGKQLGYDVTIVYPRTTTNGDIPEFLNGVRLVPLRYRKHVQFIPLWQHLNFYIYLLKHVKSINVLMRFHLSVHTEFMSIFYKKLNRKGKVYVKLDINPDGLEATYGDSKLSLKRIIHRWVTASFLRNADCFSCESTVAYQRLKESHFPQVQFGDKLQILPNGFDEELLQSMHLQERTFDEKENLLITVGRLGTSQKNTEMFLRALTKVNLQNWQVCLIGTIESRIEETIQAFYKDNPNKQESVKFIGVIKDKKKLWEYYNRAKVFVLTSNWEGYPIVYPEAKRFRNYMVSTDVAACRDIIEDGKYGVSIPINDDVRLATVLNEIVAGKRNIDVYEGYDMNKISWETQVKKIKL